jgi:hypothetical protein
MTRVKEKRTLRGDTIMGGRRDIPLAGYRKKPFAIALISIGFLLIPVALGTQMFFLSGRSWRVLAAVLTSPYFLQEWVLSWSAAGAVFIVSRWSFAYFLILSGTILTRRFFHLWVNPDLETPFSVGVTCFWFAVVLYFFASSLRVPYLNPRLRWWTRPPRIPIRREATVVYHGTPIPAVILNLSEGGVFLRLDEAVAQGRKIPRQLGEEFDLRMALMPGGRPGSPPEPFESRAQLVWMPKPDSPYRYGMGLRFTALSKGQRQRLRSAFRSLGSRRRPSCEDTSS